MFLATSLHAFSTAALPPPRPNIVVLFADDFGWGDLHSYGHSTQERGRLDEMASEGVRFTSWYSADSLCTPSRSAMMTGRLPVRTGMIPPGQSSARVLSSTSTKGLPRNETSLAEMLQARGYSTGFVGKWHLGINEKTATDGAWLSNTRGFEWVGHTLPFSNHWACDESGRHPASVETASKNCMLYYNATLVQQPIDHSNLSATFAADAVRFIAEHAAAKKPASAATTKPFFLYYAFAHMHVSMFNGPTFDASSANGLWGDGVREMDWAAGEVLDALRAHSVDDNTIVFFTSDHGPHIELCLEGGTTSTLRGGKASSSWEGGMRVPGIVRWPGGMGKVGRVVESLASTMDIFATAMALAGPPTSVAYAKREQQRLAQHPLDGVSLLPILTSIIPSEETEIHELLPFYCSSNLMAVRSGDFKLVYFREQLPFDNYSTVHCTNGFAHGEFFQTWNCFGNGVTQHDPPLLFNVASDPAERYPIAYVASECVGGAGQPGWEINNGTGGGGPGFAEQPNFDLSLESVEKCRALCCADVTNRCVSVTIGPTVNRTTEGTTSGWSCWLNAAGGKAPFARNNTLMAFVRRNATTLSPIESGAAASRGPAPGRHENKTFDKIAAAMETKVKAHRATLVGDIGVPQLGSNDKDLQPCCDPPRCTCNYPSSNPLEEAMLKRQSEL